MATVKGKVEKVILAIVILEDFKELKVESQSIVNRLLSRNIIIKSFHERSFRDVLNLNPIINKKIQVNKALPKTITVEEREIDLPSKATRLINKTDRCR
jgi:hypothetical protein